MSKSLVFNGIKDNWYLVAIIAILLTVALWGATREEATAEGTLVRSAGETTAAPGGRGPHQAKSKWAAPTRDAQLRADIENYERELALNRNSSETAVNLYRLANLYYSNMQNYEKASLYYENLLQSFPDYEGLNTVYPNLVACYRRLGNLALERHTYKRMRDYYPADSQEYLFATQSLGA